MQQSGGVSRVRDDWRRCGAHKAEVIGSELQEVSMYLTKIRMTEGRNKKSQIPHAPARPYIPPQAPVLRVSAARIQSSLLYPRIYTKPRVAISCPALKQHLCLGLGSAGIEAQHGASSHTRVDEVLCIGQHEANSENLQSRDTPPAAQQRKRLFGWGAVARWS